MKSSQITRCSALALAVCFLLATSAVNAESTATTEQGSRLPLSSLELRSPDYASAKLFLGSDSEGEMTALSSLAMAQTNKWIREINLRGTDNMTLSGAPGETVVMRLRDLRMGANSVLTLDGAADTTYIIKIRNGLSLSGNAQVALTGGLTWDDVTFKLRGGGEAVQLNGSAWLEGIVMARKRRVSLRNQATIYGDAVGWISLSDSAQIIHPPVVSP